MRRRGRNRTALSSPERKLSRSGRIWIPGVELPLKYRERRLMQQLVAAPNAAIRTWKKQLDSASAERARAVLDELLVEHAGVPARVEHWNGLGPALVIG